MSRKVNDVVVVGVALLGFLITLAWIILKGVFTPLGTLSLFFLWRARY